MGFNHLEWHQHAGGWVARIALTEKAEGKVTAYRRYAHVNIYDWAVKRKGALVPVQFQFYKQGYDVTWHNDIDSAKLHVEAIFALDNDETDSLIHWR
jgi:hypothetical protein